MIRKHRREASEIMHAGLAAAALAGAFLLRFEFSLESEYRRMLWLALPFVLAAKTAVFRAFSLRDLSWRFIGFADLSRIAAANVIASGACVALLRMGIGSAFPRSIYVLDLILCCGLLMAVRAAARYGSERRASRGPRGARRILIYGAGQAGRMLLSEIRANSGWSGHVVGIVDDDPAKFGQWLNGARVWGPGTQLAEIARRKRVDEVLLAIPSAPVATIAAILERCHAVPLATKIIPPLTELVKTRVLAEQIREVRAEDLLGRPPVRLEEAALRGALTGKIVLVTGAAGSIGSELCRQIAHFDPRAIIGFDQAETALFHLEQELRARFPRLVFHAEVGSIQNPRRVAGLFRDYRPQSVYHAAAYKHVPVMETHLFEAIENNVFGTHHVARSAANFGAETFVLVSSDKAVRPANIMGASKRMAELVSLAMAAESPGTRFLAVRFGNVLGSSGSVIPRFKQQIAEGGPLTVTHPEMQRFFMTIPEAAQLVLQAAASSFSGGPSGGASGEIFVLEMGEPVRIVDLARKMVLLSGLVPGRDIHIEFTGIRPGEKLYEELSAYEEDTVPTPHEQIRAYRGRAVSGAAMRLCLADLRRFIETRDAAGILLCLKEWIPEYNPSRTVLQRVLGRPASMEAGSRLAVAAAR